MADRNDSEHAMQRNTSRVASVDVRDAALNRARAMLALMSGGTEEAMENFASLSADTRDSLLQACQAHVRRAIDAQALIAARPIDELLQLNAMLTAACGSDEAIGNLARMSPAARDAYLEACSAQADMAIGAARPAWLDRLTLSKCDLGDAGPSLARAGPSWNADPAPSSSAACPLHEL